MAESSVGDVLPCDGHGEAALEALVAGLRCGSGGAAVLHSAVRQRVGGDGAEAANSSNTEVETCARRWREVGMVKARRPRMGSGGRVWVAVAMRPWAVTVNRWRGLVAAQGPRRLQRAQRLHELQWSGGVWPHGLWRLGGSSVVILAGGGWIR